EDLGVDGPGVHEVVDETIVLTDGGDHGRGLHLQVGVVDADPLSVVGPALGPESVEGEHGLVKVDHLCLLLHLLENGAHALEERLVVRLGEVDLALAALDVLEPDLVSDVDSADAQLGVLHLTEPPVEHL
ncbi:MAG: hypothetical protein ACK56F_12085, partial [bacterium]